ncbi:MAG: protein kinase, partial [Deltaproteobacteria bacterium]|nr:protein kinase [Deltaproteobacteria bacterium]
MTRCPACGTRSLGAHGTCPARAAESSAEPPTPHLNGFVPERALGTGAFATVFSARRVSDGRQVALKVAPLQPPEARVQLDAEAQVLAALGPPWSPELLGRAQLADGAPVLVLEQVPGRTLAALLAEEPPVLPLPRLVELARPVLDAVAALHARGWAHLDVKPENVLLDGSPLTARLLDYSLAQPRDAAQVNEAFTGTPDSMAPEQVRGLAADARADVYALGVLLFELACGRPPFLGTSAEVRQAHVSLRAPRPSTLAQLPAPLEALLLKCLTKEPESRFADASELRAAFDLAVTAEVRAATQSQGAEEGLVRRKAALVFMQSTAGLAALQSALAAAGGVLGHAAKGRAVGVFEADASHDPVGRALRTARGLIERGMIERARIDVGEITRQQRSGGPPRLISTAFLQDDRYPVRTDPAGPVLTPAAQEILPNRAQDTGNEVSERLRAGVTPITPLVELAQQVQPHPLVGRASVLDGLTESARNAVENRLPTASLVLGEVGIGKSHTCAALAERLRLRLPEVQIVELRLREPVAGLPDEALRLLLASALDLPAEATAAQARDRLTAALGEHAAAEAWPAVVVGLGLPEPEDERLLSLRAAPGALRALSVRALGEALRCRAAQRPLCVLIDDAHFADDAALDALEFASLAEARAPLWLCLWARPAFEQSRRRFGERAASRRVSQLSPLEPEAARELCKALLLPAENTPVEAIDRLVQRAQGMPLLLVELVRGLKRDGLVRRKSRGAGWFLATEGLDRLPELPLIEWLAERELSALATDLAAHARLTSLLGPEFTAAEVEGILAELDREQIAARFPLDVRVGNLRLTASGLLAAGTGAALRFRHALVRDAVARTVSAPLRKAIHRAATRFYRIGGSAHGPSRLALLAWHAARAEDEPGPLRTEAAGIYLELAERARVRHAYVEAETTFTRALELLP